MLLYIIVEWAISAFFVSDRPKIIGNHELRMVSGTKVMDW